jgi:hypothetical protein
VTLIIDLFLRFKHWGLKTGSEGIVIIINLEMKQSLIFFYLSLLFGRKYMKGLPYQRISLSVVSGGTGINNRSDAYIL